MINSSNGAITLNPDTLRGEAVTFGDVTPLDLEEGEYTHLISYHGELNAGSTLLTGSEARKLLAARVRIAEASGDAEARGKAVRDMAEFDGGMVLAL